MNQKIAELSYDQASNNKVRTKIQLFNKRHLKVEIENEKEHKKYSLDLVAVNPKSVEKIMVVWRWLAVAGGSATLGLMALIWSTTSDNPDTSVPLSILGILLFVVAGFFGILFLRRSGRKQVFVSRLAKIPVVEIFSSKRKSKRFRQFIRLLEQTIEQVGRDAGTSQQELQAGELRMLRRLVGKRAISQMAYETAKQKLLR